MILEYMEHDTVGVFHPVCLKIEVRTKHPRKLEDQRASVFFSSRTEVLTV